MTTDKKHMDQVRELDLTDEDVALIKAIHEKLPDGKDRRAFLALLEESPTLLRVARFTRYSVTSYKLGRKALLYLLGAILAINVFSAEVGKLVLWLGSLLSR